MTPSSSGGGNSVIEKFDPKYHDRSAFECSNETLNVYLKTQANQDVKRRLAFSYVLTFGDDPAIRGFYTLSASSVVLNDLPPKLVGKIPYEAVPAALIGRFAIDASITGQGWGEVLFVNALRRIAASGDLAVNLIIVDPKDKKAGAFYEKRGFLPLIGDQSQRLFIPVKTVMNL